MMTDGRTELSQANSGQGAGKAAFGSSVSIRECRIEDCANASRLWEQCGLTRPWNDPAADFYMALNSLSSAVIGGFINEHLIATVMVGFDGHRGWVYYLGVHPDHQRRGIARRMMQGAEAWLGGKGASTLRLMVRDGNSPALAFYEKLGFERQSVAVLGRAL